MPTDFIWPLNKTSTPDEMNTSYGPRIDADRWDFHDGIDLPAAVGTPVHAMATIQVQEERIVLHGPGHGKRRAVGPGQSAVENFVGMEKPGRRELGQTIGGGAERRR